MTDITDTLRSVANTCDAAGAHRITNIYWREEAAVFSQAQYEAVIHELEGGTRTLQGPAA